MIIMKNIIFLISISSSFFSCRESAQHKNIPQNYSFQNTDTTNTYITDMDDISLIKKHLELQKRLELSEDDTNLSHLYHMQDSDIEIAAEIIDKILKNNGYRNPTNEEFNNKVNTVFDLDNAEKCINVVEHKNFYTYLISQNNEAHLKETEYDYTYDHIFFIKNYNFITYLPLLGDIVKITKDDKVKINVDQKIISRNKYLFNGSKADLAYLIHNDQDFLKTLVTVFGYDKEPQINKLVMDYYSQQEYNKRETVGEIIFIKDCANKLKIAQDLLKYIDNNTNTKENTLLYALEAYGFALYDEDRNNVYKIDPSKKFTSEEKAKIVAYIANIAGPSFVKYSPYSYSAASERKGDENIWTHKGSFLYNLSVSHPEIIDIIEKNNYYELTHLKNVIELLQDEAPPAPAE